jgi:hypothetical protein
MFAAITEYKRYLFFGNPGDSGEAAIDDEIGSRLASAGNYGDALDWLESSVRLSLAENVRAARLLEASMVAAKAHLIDKAYILVSLVPTDLNDSALRKRRYLCSGLINLQKSNWENAKNDFAGYFENSPRLYAQLKTWIHDNPPPKPRNATLAVTLSCCIPGAGQAYAGDPGDGINALAINAATGYPLAAALYALQWNDVVFWTWLFSRFYRGNIITTGEDVEHCNGRRNDEYRSKYLAVLQEKITSKEGNEAIK